MPFLGSEISLMFKVWLVWSRFGLMSRFSLCLAPCWPSDLHWGLSHHSIGIRNWLKFKLVTNMLLWAIDHGSMLIHGMIHQFSCFRLYVTLYDTSIMLRLLINNRKLLSFWHLLLRHLQLGFYHAAFSLSSWSNASMIEDLINLKLLHASSIGNAFLLSILLIGHIGNLLICLSLLAIIESVSKLFSRLSLTFLLLTFSFSQCINIL